MIPESEQSEGDAAYHEWERHVFDCPHCTVFPWGLCDQGEHLRLVALRKLDLTEETQVEDTE